MHSKCDETFPYIYTWNKWREFNYYFVWMCLLVCQIRRRTKSNTNKCSSRKYECILALTEYSQSDTYVCVRNSVCVSGSSDSVVSANIKWIHGFGFDVRVSVCIHLHRTYNIYIHKHFHTWSFRRCFISLVKRFQRKRLSSMSHLHHGQYSSIWLETTITQSPLSVLFRSGCKQTASVDVDQIQFVNFMPELLYASYRRMIHKSCELNVGQFVMQNLH